MFIGVPKEIKNNPYRVAMTPGGVRQLTDAGHEVRVETTAGDGNGFGDEQYATTGARIVPTAAEAWAADERLTDEMMSCGLTGCESWMRCPVEGLPH